MRVRYTARAGRLRPRRAAGDRAGRTPRVPAGAELGAGAELPGRPQPPGLRKKSCSEPQLPFRPISGRKSGRTLDGGNGR